MSVLIWRAVGELAAVWRSSAYVQEYSAGASGPLHLCDTSGHHIAAQPFYLSRYLPTHPRYSSRARSPRRDDWQGKGKDLEAGYTLVIEWIRSRLYGYPFPGSPQLTQPSPWTTFNVSMHVPWLHQLRAWQLHNQVNPPTIPVLGVDQATQLEAGAHLGAAIAASPPAIEVEAAWKSLTEIDKDQLRATSVAMQKVSYLEPNDVTGTDDFRGLAWAETILDEAIRSLTGRARVFTDALTAADRLIQQAAALFSQLIFYNQVRQLGQVFSVDLLDGADGWHTIRSNSFILVDHPRLREILAFDYPYPRGVMLVAGIHEQLPFDNRQATLSVHGHILADSEELAASVVPIRSIHTGFHQP
ncbi:hypothetical protein [Frankia sp. R82]|uniref:hypothetical protein n=1 Tax=Frankia sp. R82 TaxID=2950553 RepID=UPI002042E6AB|nr:hypothetical protein [Frankia sp. R82]MCM3882239.1 hypothetical protein [Frankia sp. R82]